MSVLEIPAGARAVALVGAKAAGRVALVDEADYETVGGYRWYVAQYKRVDGTLGAIYAQTSGSRKMHRLITGYALTDHINRNGLDNRRCNLRPATKAQNRANSSKQAGSSSRFKGVVRYGTAGKWRALIAHGGRVVSLGYYVSDVDAARAYDVAAIAYWGPFAGTNFPASDYPGITQIAA